MDAPGTNRVDGDFFPRRRNVVSRRVVAITRARFLVFLTLFAGGDVLVDLGLQIWNKEVSRKRFDKAIDSTMAEYNVIPNDCIVGQSLRQNNPPLIVGTATNEFLAVERLQIIVVAIGEGKHFRAVLLLSGDVGEGEREFIDFFWIKKETFGEFRVGVEVLLFVD